MCILRMPGDVARRSGNASGFPEVGHGWSLLEIRPPQCRSPSLLESHHMNARREGIITESLFLRELDNRMGFAVGMPMRQQTVSSSLPVARAAPAVAPHRRRSHFLIPLPHKMPAPAQQIPMPRPTLFSSPPVARAAPAVAPHRRRSRFLIPLPHKMPAPSPTNTHAATDTLLFSAHGVVAP